MGNGEVLKNKRKYFDYEKFHEYENYKPDDEAANF